MDEVVAAVAGGPHGGPGHRRRDARRSRTPGPGWSAAVAAAGLTVTVVPGALGRAGRPGGERTAHRPLLLRGLPAPVGPGPPGRAGRPSPPSPGPPSCSRRPVGWLRPWPTWRTPVGRRPAGGGGPGADQAPRGGLAGDAGRRRPPGPGSGRCGARWCWCSPGRPRWRRSVAGDDVLAAALAGRLAAGERTRGAVDEVAAASGCPADGSTSWRWRPGATGRPTRRSPARPGTARTLRLPAEGGRRARARPAAPIGWTQALPRDGRRSRRARRT